MLFSTETEEDTLAVGDTVKLPEGETGGTFELSDGRKVVVADGVVTEISEAEPEPQEDPEKEALKAELANARELIVELQNKIGSNFTPPARQNKVDKGAEPAKGVDVAAMREKREKFKNYAKGGLK